VDLLRGRPGTWLAPEISAEALSATLLAALNAVRPGERVSHSFFPAPAGTAQKIAVEKARETNPR